jgi:hypothetical protein
MQKKKKKKKKKNYCLSQLFYVFSSVCGKFAIMTAKVEVTRNERSISSAPVTMFGIDFRRFGNTTGLLIVIAIAFISHSVYAYYQERFLKIGKFHFHWSYVVLQSLFYASVSWFSSKQVFFLFFIIIIIILIIIIFFFIFSTNIN